MNRRSLVRWAGLGGTAMAVAGVPQIQSAPPSGATFFNVRDFGAVGDGKILETGPLQAAIDACHSSGGGVVIVPAGVYLTGTLILKSRVALWLHPGAVLLGSTKLEDYPVKIPAFRSYTDVNYVERSLIYAEKATDIAIFGEGAIDGQGAAAEFRKDGKPKPYKERPYLMRFIECQRLKLTGITLRNSAMWVQHYLACDDVLLDGITVHSLVNGNNDGIDIDCCRRFCVANCNITSGDDAIVLKSTGPRPCAGITVTNCRLTTLCNALKCGTESSGGFYDIAISNCVVEDTRLAGIALEAVDGGTLDGITINNIRLRRTGGAIFLRLGNRARPYLSKGPGGGRGVHVVEEGMKIPGVARFRNVHISQVSGETFDVTGCALAGIPGHPLENITLEDIDLEFAGGGKSSSSGLEVPENEKAYPEYKMFGRLPAFGFYCRHAKGLHLRDVHVRSAMPETRPAMICNDVEQLEVRGWQSAGVPKEAPEIILNQVKDGWIHHCRAARETAAFVQVNGQESRDILLANNLCPKGCAPLNVAKEVPPGAARTTG